MFVFLIIVHVLVCLVLILAILLQAGRGAGLGGFVGGGAAQQLLGANTNDFMTKTTTVCAIFFLVTCLSLAVLTSKRSRSLLEGTVPVTAPMIIEETLPVIEEESPEGEVQLEKVEKAVMDSQPEAPVFPDVEETPPKE